jgi:hypothetical protein
MPSTAPKITKKGVYEDGHERKDVVVYRREVVLPLMSEVERRSVSFGPQGEGWVEIPPQLKEGEKRVVVY